MSHNGGGECTYGLKDMASGFGTQGSNRPNNGTALWAGRNIRKNTQHGCGEIHIEWGVSANKDACRHGSDNCCGYRLVGDEGCREVCVVAWECFGVDVEVAPGVVAMGFVSYLGCGLFAVFHVFPPVVALHSLIISPFSLIIVMYFVAVGFTPPIGGGFFVLGFAMDTPRIIILLSIIIISLCYLYCNSLASSCTNLAIFCVNFPGLVSLTSTMTTFLGLHFFIILFAAS